MKITIVNMYSMPCFPRTSNEIVTNYDNNHTTVLLNVVKPNIIAICVYHITIIDSYSRYFLYRCGSDIMTKIF